MMSKDFGLFAHATIKPISITMRVIMPMPVFGICLCSPANSLSTPVSLKSLVQAPKCLLSMFDFNS